MHLLIAFRKITAIPIPLTSICLPSARFQQFLTSSLSLYLPLLPSDLPTLCLPFAYPWPTFCLPFDYPLPTLCLPFAYPLPAPFRSTEIPGTLISHQWVGVAECVVFCPTWVGVALQYRKSSSRSEAEQSADRAAHDRAADDRAAHDRAADERTADERLSCADSDRLLAE